MRPQEHLFAPFAYGGRAATLPNASMTSFLRTPLRKCAIVIDRHVHKNGGSTVRDLFLEHERTGQALYQGYTQLYWRQIFSKLQKLFVQAAETGQAPRIQMLIEAHFGWVELNGPIMKDLHSLREVATDCPCIDPTPIFSGLEQTVVGCRNASDSCLLGFDSRRHGIPNLAAPFAWSARAARRR